MKIISKYRDYYDHMVSKYGFDESRVYDRRGKIVHDPFSGWNEFLISICGTYYPIVVHHKTRKLFFESDKQLTYWEDNFICRYRGKKSPLNEKFRQPVLMDASDHNGKIFYSIPLLANFKFASIIEPDEMYQSIYNFLGWLKDNPEPPNTQTDKDKIVAHGFDAKRSFRPQIKD